MDPDKALLFYEKLYFHELENREKLSARLQLSLGLLTLLAGVFAYMATRYNAKAVVAFGVDDAFFLLTALALILLGTGAWFFVKAFWGHDYHCLPTATTIEDYRKTLGITYRDFADGDALASDHYRDFLIKYFAECASSNAGVNGARADFLHRSNGCILVAIPFAVLAAMTFIFGGLGLPPGP